MGSIPVRVTTSTAHIWLNKAVCELFFLLIFRLVRYLSANRMTQKRDRSNFVAPDVAQLRATGAIGKIVHDGEYQASFFCLSKKLNAPSIASATRACAVWN